MNPILGMLNAKTPNPINPIDNVNNVPNTSSPANLLASFTQFKKQMEGKDPKAIIDELRASGRMSDAQYNNLLKRAQELQAFLK